MLDPQKLPHLSNLSSTSQLTSSFVTPFFSSPAKTPCFFFPFQIPIKSIFFAFCNTHFQSPTLPPISHTKILRLSSHNSNLSTPTNGNKFNRCFE
ncbi:hypothetical protein L6452_39614 [Arctium lappa]|uniref:Uncharacterized protein n=1 Tax=Arctium lappa TaxID=4217 RepID=A0ACB8XSS3_ARCLA|nr:hypothetical protein L6452_39614 [Arctium lappa]